MKITGYTLKIELDEPIEDKELVITIEDKESFIKEVRGIIDRAEYKVDEHNKKTV